MKLHLVGHIRNDPKRIVNWDYSWPEGATEDKIRDAVASFNEAFAVLEIKVEL